MTPKQANSFKLSNFCLYLSLPVDVTNRVRNGESIPYRPVLPESTELGRPMLDLIRACWSEDLDERPLPKQIRTALRRIAGGEYVSHYVLYS